MSSSLETYGPPPSPDPGSPPCSPESGIHGAGARIAAFLVCLLAFESFLAAGMIPGALAASAAAAWLACLAWHPAAGRPAGWPMLLAAALAAYTAAMALPLPRALVLTLSPGREAQDHLVRRAIGGAAGLGLLDPFSPAFCLSRNRAGTIRAALLLLAGIAAAALSSSLDRRWKERYLAAAVALAALIASLGFVSQWVLPQGKSVWWLFEVPHGRPVACFVNRNHFGGFVSMFCPAALVLSASRLSARRMAGGLWWALLFAAMTCAVALSLSRGAWVSWAAGMAVLLAAAALRRRLAVAAVVLAAAGATAWALASARNPALTARAETLTAGSPIEQGRARLATWRDSLRIVPDYPVLGIGANAFGMVFPGYARTVSRKVFQHAENDYVQFVAEYGLAGSALAAALAWAAAAAWLRGRRRAPQGYVVELGVIGALGAAAAHAALDFPLRVPLSFTALCSIAGLALPPPAARDAAAPRLARAAIPLAALALVGCLSLPGRRIHAMDSPQFISSAPPRDLCRALAWSPTSWQAWYDLGRTAIEERSAEGYPLGEWCLTRAAACNPNDYELWYELGTLRQSMGDNEGARAAAEELKRRSSWLRFPTNAPPGRPGR